MMSLENGLKEKAVGVIQLAIALWALFHMVNREVKGGSKPKKRR